MIGVGDVTSYKKHANRLRNTISLIISVIINDRGVGGGGSRSKMRFRVKFNYVLSGTFYGIKKACHGRSVLSRSWHVPQNPTRFWTSTFFNGKIRQTLFIWLQISFGAPFLAKLLHFLSFPNGTWEFGLDFGT